MATNGTPEQPEPARSAGEQSSGGGLSSGAKWFIIGGAGGGVALVVVIAVVVVLLVTGVFGGGGVGASGGTDVLAYIPGDAGLVIIGDNLAVLNGDVPEDFIEYMEEASDGDSEYGISSDAYEAIDIDDDDVSLVAFTADKNGNESLAIVQGDFEFDIIREELEDGLDCDDDDYRGFELWECPGAEFPAVALFEKDGYIVFAVERQDDLEDLLTLKSRTPEKLADAKDSEIQEILDQVGNGWLRVAFLTDDCVINRCEGFAFAIQKSDDSESIPASYAVMFTSERAATAAEGDVEIDELAESFFVAFALELNIGEVKADGEFVVGNGIAEFVDPDAPRSSNQNSGGISRDREGSTRPAAVMATPNPAPTQAPTQAAPTPTPVPIREPESVFNLIPESSQHLLLVRWDQTQSGGFLPNTLEQRVFAAIDFAKNAYDISPDHISEIAFVDNISLTVLHGDFDLGIVRNMLEDQDAEPITYRGYEMWTYNRGRIILFEHYIAYGSGLENILQSLYRGSGSLADASENNDMKQVLGKLDDGIIVWAERNCPFENCLGYGWSIAEVDESADTGIINIEFLFRNERSAREAADDYNGIANFLQRQRINIHDTVANENFVAGNAVWEFGQ